METPQGQFETRVISRTCPTHGQIDINVALMGPSDGDIVVLVHGWPEGWQTWKGQMRHLADSGYRAAAIDVRGYGASSRPEAVSAYRLRDLASDIAEVINGLSPAAPVVLVGHDWGAPAVYQTARLFPDLVKAVVGMSVPYLPVSVGDPMELWDMIYADRFFYMKYFQEVGVAEAAFSRDLGSALRKIYFAASADAPEGLWTSDQPEGSAMLDFLTDPDPAPEWLTKELVDEAITANAGGPLHGWFNRYRAQGLDGEDLGAEGDGTPPSQIQQPACFVAGSRDIVRTFVPGVDMFDLAAEGYADPRGVTIIDDAGHWVHHEQAGAVNDAIVDFLGSV